VVVLQEELASSRLLVEEQADRASRLEEALTVAQQRVAQVEEESRMSAGSADEAHTALLAQVGGCTPPKDPRQTNAWQQ
jgi:hypothetical protein